MEENSKTMMEKLTPYLAPLFGGAFSAVLIAWGMMASMSTKIEVIERDIDKHEISIQRDLKRIEGEIAKYEISRERETKRADEAEIRFAKRTLKHAEA